MSADGEGKKRIHFGSLEEVEKKRIKLQQQNGGEGMGLSAAVIAGIKAGNINITEGQIGRVNNVTCSVHAFKKMGPKRSEARVHVGSIGFEFFFS